MVRPNRGNTAREPVVYYVSIGGLIKIGTTTDLRARLKAYGPAAKILATESGGRGTEGQRHCEFRADLIAGNEWFRPSEAIMQHIAELNADGDLEERLWREAVLTVPCRKRHRTT